MAAATTEINSLIVDLWREKIDIFGVKNIVKAKNEDVTKNLIGILKFFWIQELNNFY